MVHPVLTVVFDIFLIGSAAAIISAMVAEHRQHRSGAVGNAHPQRTIRSRPTQVRTYQRGQVAASRRRHARAA